MRYTILIEKRAEKFIGKLPQPDKERILRAIYKLPNEGDRKRLQGANSKGFYRLRIGDFRVIYTVENDRLIVRIVEIGNRGQIYNRR